MPTIIKGQSFTADFTSADFPVLSDDWTATADLVADGASAATLSYVLSRVGNAMRIYMPVADVNNLEAGLYKFIAEFANPSIGLTLTSSTLVTVAPAAAMGGSQTTITMTIAKIDGSPAGKETRELVNTDDGTQIVLGWKGVTVTASHPVADEVTGVIIGTETVSTTTNAAGYAQLSVIKGQTVTISCPSFGKSVTIDTTGLDSIDLSTHF